MWGTGSINIVCSEGEDRTGLRGHWMTCIERSSNKIYGMKDNAVVQAKTLLKQSIFQIKSTRKI